MSHRSQSALLLLTLLAPTLVVGCASSPEVITHQDPNADFAAYKTFGFPPKLGTDTAEYDTILSQFLKDAAVLELTARGYAPSDEPDLLVNLYVRTQQQAREVPGPGSTYGGRMYDPWRGYADEPVVVRYTEGTLNVDLVDRARSQLVWEAAVVGTVTKEAREKLRETAERAMKEAFARYPFVAGSSTPKK